jgi:hypothetical protein
MFRRYMGDRLAGFGVATILVLLVQGATAAQEILGGCSSCASCVTNCYHCQRHHCPPRFRWCQQGPPRLKFERGCPLPVCDPCAAPNWGYHQTCWTPWPWQPDWSHCPAPPPASMVFPGLAPGGSQLPVESLPAPRMQGRPPL